MNVNIRLKVTCPPIASFFMKLTSIKVETDSKYLRNIWAWSRFLCQWWMQKLTCILSVWKMGLNWQQVMLIWRWWSNQIWQISLSLLEILKKRLRLEFPKSKLRPWLFLQHYHLCSKNFYTGITNWTICHFIDSSDFQSLEFYQRDWLSFGIVYHSVLLVSLEQHTNDHGGPKGNGQISSSH